MLMLTKEIQKRLPKIGATDDKPAAERKVIVKFFSIASQHRYYVLEGRKLDDGDWELFGYTTVGDEGEYGYSLLSELMSARWKGIPAIERDMHYGDHTLQEVKDRLPAAI
jgi:hypothetical protein